MKLWAGRFSKEADKKTNDFNSSIKTDSRMFNEDIDGSIAHASMLAAKGIISEEDCKKILAGLSDIRNDIISGELMIDPDAEDIHTFIEGELTSRIGDAGKRLHTGRSRNDQVAVDIRLYLKKDVPQVTGLINGLIDALDGKAKEYAHCIMPGYTHLQRAQPITFAAHIGAYIEMLRRDLGRFEDAAGRMNYSPLGSGALAGTTYPIDRAMTAKALGFDGYMPNTHIDRFHCMGNYLRTINELLRQRNYIGALEQCIASCKSLNFGDSAVMGEFMKTMWSNGSVSRCIELPDGRVVKPNEAIRWLEEQEAQNGQAEEAQNEQTN